MPSLWTALVLLAAGCGGGGEARLGDYLDELEFDAPLDSARTVPLGRFDVPVPVRIKVDDAEQNVWIRLTFDLFAETSPEHEKDLASAASRHQGALNDVLLTTIRTSSPDELTDPRLAALKLRMTEAARPLLGQRQLRQLVIPNPVTDRL